MANLAGPARLTLIPARGDHPSPLHLAGPRKGRHLNSSPAGSGLNGHPPGQSIPSHPAASSEGAAESLITTSQSPPGNRTDPLFAAFEDRPDEDTAEVRLGEWAVVEALCCTWGEAYEVGVDEGQWWFRRKDGIGGTETATSPDRLLAQMVIDHDCLPVRCAPPARFPADGS